MKNLENKLGFGATIFSLILALSTALSCDKKEKGFAYVSEGPPSKEKTENPAEIYIKKALNFKEQGQLDSALVYSTKAINNQRILESEQVGNMHYLRAQIHQYFSRNKEAIEDYEDAIYCYSSKMMTKECIPIYLEMTELHEKLGDKEKAEECKRLAERFEEYRRTH